MESLVTGVSGWDACVSGLEFWFNEKMQELYETTTVTENSDLDAIHKWRTEAEISLKNLFQEVMNFPLILQR